MANSNCRLCRHFDLQPNQDLGQCRRYPTYQNRHATEWCGEFAVAGVTTVTVGNMTTVFSDLPDTIENLVAAAELQESYGSSSITEPNFVAEQKEFTNQLRKLVDTPAKRKPGRPKLSGRQIP